MCHIVYILYSLLLKTYLWVHFCQCYFHKTCSTQITQTSPKQNPPCPVLFFSLSANVDKITELRLFPPQIEFLYKLNCELPSGLRSKNPVEQFYFVRVWLPLSWHPVRIFLTLCWHELSSPVEKTLWVKTNKNSPEQIRDGVLGRSVSIVKPSEHEDLGCSFKAP